jgi:D-alanine-D-alanine ligase
MRLLVLFGGQSSEHEVSRVSASNVLEHMDKEKYEIYTIGITKAGKWLFYQGPVSNIRDGSWEADPGNRAAFVSPDATVGGIVFSDGKILPVDVVFPVLHGKNGEDGTVQGLLTLARIPYVGCHVTASAVAMDKVLCKMIFDRMGVPQAKWTYFYKNALLTDLPGCMGEAEKEFSYPFFVKPANAGSSVGITKAHSREELEKALLTAAEHDEKILLEESITGRELECAVLGNENPVASMCGEIFPGKEFYDYEAKYADAGSITKVPADLPEEIHKAVGRRAVEVYRTLNCKGMARVDFFLVEGDRVIFNEINTIPGFTSISMYPMMMEASGVSYTKLIDELVTYAVRAGGGGGC